VKRSAVLGITLLAALRGLPAAAQQAGKTYRVGILVGGTGASFSRNLAAFRRTLSGLGYQEGKNLAISYRSAGGYSERLPALAADLVRAKPDVIVVSGTAITPAKRATTSVPIVMMQATDPVGLGIVASLARPGGNITGMTNIEAELTGKRLQLLKELVPNLQRVAVVRSPSSNGNMISWRTAENVGRTIGIQVVAVDIPSPDQVDVAFKALPHLRVDGILVLNGPGVAENAARFVRLVAAQRLPAVYDMEAYASAGGLIAYGPSDVGTWSQVATYVARILKGANPADLPVERPTTFDLAVNLKTARALGITVPQSILLRATQVIQ
jgi:putative tryptophan/tyrosine transport system substrate-binding protein